MLDRVTIAWQALRGTHTRSANLFDVARVSNRNKLRPSSDFARIGSMPILRNNARDAERNNAIAKALVSSLVTNIIGAGIKPQLRGDVAEEFMRWTDQADFNGRHDFYGLQQAACKAMVVDGEVFIVLRVNPGLRVPLQLQLLAAEHLDASRVGPRIHEGIEFDEHGRRSGYWLYPKSPALFPSVTSVRMPAEQVIHVFQPSQPGAERGASWLAPVLLNLNEIRDYCESERIRLAMASLFTAAITTPDKGLTLGEGRDLYEELKTGDFQPGSVFSLNPGESVNWNRPPESGSTFEHFLQVQLRQVGACFGLPYELLTGDLSQVTFASGRHGLLEFRRRLESIQHHVIVHQFCRPVIDAFMRYGNAAGVLPLPPAANIRWIAPLPEMLDAQGEIAAEIARIRAGLKSRSEAVAATGWDIEQIDREIAADNARADDLGLVLDSDPRKLTLQGQVQQQNATATAAPGSQQMAKGQQEEILKEKQPA